MKAVLNKDTVTPHLNEESGITAIVMEEFETLLLFSQAIQGMSSLTIQLRGPKIQITETI